MLSVRSLGGYVLVDDGLDGAVGDQLVERGVDGVEQGGVALVQADGVILVGILGVKDGEAGVVLDKLLSRSVVMTTQSTWPFMRAWTAVKPSS